MTVLFMGGEMGAFIPSGAAAVEVTATTDDAYNADFARCAIKINGSSDYIESADVITGADLWAHFEMSVRSGSFADERVRFQWLDGGGTPILRMVQIYSGSVLRLDYWNGAAWVTAGSSIVVNMAQVRQTIDINVVCNTASGSVKLYLSGTKRIDSGTIDLAHVTDLGLIRFYGATTSSISYYTYVSQVAVSDAPTIGGRVKTVPLTGAGANSDFTGTYAGIDEAVYDDADFIFSDTATDVSLFAHATTIPTGYTLRAIGVTARARRGVGGPQNLQLAIRATSANAFSGTVALDVGYTANVYVWNTNPTTAVDWVNGDFAGVQGGVKAIA